MAVTNRIARKVKMLKKRLRSAEKSLKARKRRKKRR
jgi:hypothetical protein